VTACICHRSVPSGWTRNFKLIDHRYFYHLDNGSGQHTCGLVRDAVAEQLLEWNLNFADTDFLNSLAEYIDNQSVTGFLIEYAVLSSIQSNGLAIFADLKTSMEVKLFNGVSDINMDIVDRPVLYRPRKYNFKAIDGLIVLIKSGKLKDARKTLSIYPLQITLTPATHRPSREQFFEEYGKWITDISKFDVKVEFLWITPICRQIRNYRAEPKQHWPKHKERYIPFLQIDEGIWEKYEDASGRLPKDKAAQRKLLPNPGITKAPATEEPATEEPATEEPATEEPATEEPAPQNPTPEGATEARATKGAQAAPAVPKGTTRGKGARGGAAMAQAAPAVPKGATRGKGARGGAAMAQAAPAVSARAERARARAAKS